MKENKSKKWFLIEEIQRADLFRCYLAVEAICAERDLKGIDVQVRNGAVGLFKEKSDLIFEKGEWERNGRYLLDLIKDQKSKFFKKVNIGIANSAIELNGYIDNKIFRKKTLSFEEAMNGYRKTASLLANLYNWAFIYELLELGEKKLLTAYLKDVLSIKTQESVDDYFNILTQSVKESWIEKEKIEFLKLAIDKNSNVLIGKHFQKFFWIPSFGSFAIWDINYFKNKLKNLKENPKELLNKIKEEKRKAKKMIAKTEKELNLTKEERNMFSEIREMVYFKDYRRGVQNKLFLAIYRNISPVLEKELSVKREDLQWLTLEELERGWFDKKEIEKRKEGCLFIIKDGERGKTLVGDPKDLLNYRGVENEVGEEVRGTVAYGGSETILRGRVKIILNRGDMKKFEKGDILVSYMTNPDLIEAIYKAKAIITDMGGITCHASIVARELKKPCIIGTRIAR